MLTYLFIRYMIASSIAVSSFVHFSCFHISLKQNVSPIRIFVVEKATREQAKGQNRLYYLQ